MAYLGEFEQLILFSVLRLGDEAYGVAIGQEIEGRTGRTVSAGAIYTTLGRLEERGMVTSRVGESAPGRGGRRRKYYSIASAGARALHDSYATIHRMARGLVPELGRLAGETEAGES